MKLYAGQSRKLPPLYDRLSDGGMRPVTATAIEWSVEPASLGSVADGKLVAAPDAGGRSGTLTATATYADGRAFAAFCPLAVEEPPAGPPGPPPTVNVEDLILVDPD